MKISATAQRNRGKDSVWSRFNPATLAETVWFVSSFVISVIMGPFSALPALFALFSLHCEGCFPPAASK